MLPTLSSRGMCSSKCNFNTLNELSNDGRDGQLYIYIVTDMVIIPTHIKSYLWIQEGAFSYICCLFFQSGVSFCDVDKCVKFKG